MYLSDELLIAQGADEARLVPKGRSVGLGFVNVGRGSTEVGVDLEMEESGPDGTSSLWSSRVSVGSDSLSVFKMSSSSLCPMLCCLHFPAAASAFFPGMQDSESVGLGRTAPVVQTQHPSFCSSQLLSEKIITIKLVNLYKSELENRIVWGNFSLNNLPVWTLVHSSLRINRNSLLWLYSKVSELWKSPTQSCSRPWGGAVDNRLGSGALRGSRCHSTVCWSYSRLGQGRDEVSGPRKRDSIGLLITSGSHMSQQQRLTRPCPFLLKLYQTNKNKKNMF